MQKKLLKIVIFIIAFIASGAGSYGVFSASDSGEVIAEVETQPSMQGNDYGAKTFNDALPKTEPCPLNGAMFSKKQKEWWESHRPLGVMIENHLEARPQSGISFADVVYEMIAEGGITRLLAVYYCEDGGIIGPIRSARTYFLDYISEYGDYPLYAHVGGANTPGPANALGQITDYGWSGYNGLNQFSIGYPTFWRDQNRLGRDVATEHTMYSNTTKLWDFAEKRGLTNTDKKGESWDTNFVKYSFKDDAPASSRPAEQTVRVEFWGNKNYIVDWTYNKAQNVYLRSVGGKKFIDNNTKERVSAGNIVIIFTTERNADDGYENNAHLLYGTKGTGKALVFQDGKQITGTWKKSSRTARVLLYDTSGNEIKFTRGKIWFGIMSSTNVVKVE